MKAIPLHNHSHYSAFDGMATPQEIINQVKANGVDMVALTDHGTVAGHLDFYKTATKNGIKPIFGLEGYHARDSRFAKHKADHLIRRGRPKGDADHLILLAKDNIGLKNLWTLSTFSYVEGMHYRPRLDWELLQEYREGLIATSACLGSKISQAIMDELSPETVLDRYLSIFGEDFYIEIHTYDTNLQRDVNLELVHLAQKKGLGLVYATDAHYSCSSHYDAHEAMMVIASKKTISEEKDYSHPPSLWIKNEEGIRESLNYLPKSVVDECILNSQLIAEQCNATPPGKEKRIPAYKGDGATKLVELIEEAYVVKGIQNKDIDNLYSDRIEKEASVIFDADLQDFFLIQWDINRWAAENGISVGPGRGSVGGSLIAYLLGITDIDPLRYDLIFERFYNAGREKGGLPDIDTDFPADKRDLVKEYLAEKYGRGCVANLGTSLTLHGKSSIERVGKYFEIDRPDINSIKAIIDSTTDAGLLAKWEDIIKLDELQPWIKKYPKLFELAGILHGRIFTFGQHASGFLISDQELAGLFPLKYSSKDSSISTQFDMHEAEDLGFMKVDLLGLRNLDILDRTEELIPDKDFTYRIHSKSDEELKDEEFWTMLDKGLTVGLFQVEDGKAARWIAQKMKCRSIEDLAILVALNRPGPLRATNADGKTFVDLYLDRRNGHDWDYTHPFLEDIVNETYGVFVYQEQVIKFFQKIGFSPEQADDIRRVMGKKKPEELAATYPLYMEKVLDHLPENIANQIWEELEGFAKYAFNKSHSIGYGIILLWTLCTKYAYPAEFLLASIQVDGDDSARYIAEAIRMGIKIHPPDVNKSDVEATIIEGEIYYGLKDVKGVAKGAEWILENRPFESFDKMVELLEEQNKEYLLKKKAGEVEGLSPKQRINAGKIKALYNVGAFDSLEDRTISKRERRTYEKELLGIVLSDDSAKILTNNYDIIRDYCDTYEEFLNSSYSRSWTLPGSICKIKEATTRKDTDMLWVTIQYEENTLEFAVFAEQINEYSDIIEECTPIVVSLKKTNRGVNLINMMELN